MKLQLVLATTLALTTLPVDSARSNAWITVYPSPTGGGCSIWEPEGGGVMEVYVLYEGDLCVASVSSRLTSGDGFKGVYVDETVNGTTFLGNTQDGIIIADYPPPPLLATVRYMTDGTSPPCSYLEVVEHPGFGAIVVVDCALNEYHVETHGKLSVNVHHDRHVCPYIWCLASPVEATTWGRIKALFAD